MSPTGMERCWRTHVSTSEVESVTKVTQQHLTLKMPGIGKPARCSRFAILTQTWVCFATSSSISTAETTPELLDACQMLL
jgi:hypothetical protein